jgi:hypothetical protein
MNDFNQLLQELSIIISVLRGTQCKTGTRAKRVYWVYFV